MRRFKFRFEAVRTQRAALYDAAAAALAEVIARHALAVDLLTRRRQELDAHAAEGPSPGRALHPERERLRQLHLAGLRDEIQRRAQIVARMEEALAAARAEVTAAHRALRAVELLEERARAAWRLDLKRAEQSQNDERSAQRFGRH